MDSYHTLAFRLALVSSAFFAPFSRRTSTEVSLPLDPLTARGLGPQSRSGFICQRTKPLARDGGLASG